jgi:tRNA dimethylallyltransferase
VIVSSATSASLESGSPPGETASNAADSGFDPDSLAAKAIFFTGPTGAGKSDAGIALAERLGAEIVSMDSMAVFRGMDIGTAKPSRDDRRRVPHHLVDVRDPWQEFSISEYITEACRAVESIHASGHIALFVGGTPLYLKSLLHGMSRGPAPDPALRARLEQEAEQGGIDCLYRRLAGVDPAAAQRIAPTDLRRIVRALEVFEKSGQPISATQVHFHAPPRANATVYCITRPRDELYRRIDSRVDGMFSAGLVDEVRTLLSLERPLSRTARQAVGYKEVIAFLNGSGSLSETIELVKRRSRQFAKRQHTWFRSMPEIREIAVHAMDDTTKLAERILATCPIMPKRE